MPSSPASRLTCHGLSLQSRRTEEWPPVVSISLLRQHLVFSFTIHHKYKNCDNFCAGAPLEALPPPGLLVLGGQSENGQLTSVETIGFESCKIPALPETRYSFGSFIAPTQPPQLAVCGGWWMGRPNSTDCLTLNVTSAQWERGTFGNGLLGDGVRGVINIEGQGVFVVHSTSISFLATDSQSWATGPLIAASAECGCNVSSTRFVIIHMRDTNNVQEYFVSNGKAEAERDGLWPNLLTKRRGPGCAATSHHLLVAGGVSGWDEVLTSVEVFHIESKSLRKGGSLRQARAFFQIIPTGSVHMRLLAVGGQSGNSTVDTSEWWDEDDDKWEEGLTLSTGRSNFAALMAPPHLVCAEKTPPAHSCPSSKNNQTCIFPTKGAFRVKFFHSAQIIKNHCSACIIRIVSRIQRPGL